MRQWQTPESTFNLESDCASLFCRSRHALLLWTKELIPGGGERQEGGVSSVFYQIRMLATKLCLEAGKQVEELQNNIDEV